MFKKMASVAVIAVMLLGIPSVSPAEPLIISQASAAQSNVSVLLRGELLKLDRPAIIENGTTLVPLRQVAEAFGATVEWQKGSRGADTVMLKHDGETAILTLGKRTLTVSGRTIALNIAPRLEGTVTMVPLRAIGESLGAVVSWDEPTQTVMVDDPPELPVIGNASNLRKLIEDAQKYGSSNLGLTGGIAVQATANDNISAKSESSAPQPAPASGDFSKTNVQVDGVDESDWAKTDGKFIYQLSGARIMIVDIADPAAPKLAASLDYSGYSFHPQELYADNGQLVVIGYRYEPFIADASPSLKTSIIMPRPMHSTVMTKIYTIDAAGQPKLIRETELEGSYVSSRKIGSALYMVTNKYSNVYSILQYASPAEKPQASPVPDAEFEPMYRDSASADGSSPKTIPLPDIRYFPKSPESNIMMIGALDLDRPEQEMQVSAYLGSGGTVYASNKHLYVAVGRYLYEDGKSRQETTIYKFRLDQGRVVYIGEGTVPGTALNQFSLDEHEGYLRIATTKGNMWAEGSATSKNNVYVLDERLNTVGALEDLAPGERIYSARFMGNRAYMVTFRNVDPLFAIDLRDPTKPAVLGQLKIPGYSDYLHPYDDNHLIGFGKETIELPSKGSGPDATMAFYQGMKIALFDVSDVTQPKEKFKEVIGDRGTHSDLLGDHKALLFSADKGLMAFPVQLMEIKDKSRIESGGLAYGQFAYQGAYVYDISLQEGFKLRSRITHLSEEDMAKSGQYGFDYNKAVRRIVYAGNTLYTLSNNMLKANDLGNLAERGSLIYPVQK